ncbi:sulfatase [Persicirhabdus sediminis]|uniref:Sulfatase n=1 Tax=Persicirhabdus sediminis TaxID=454144 RepID=A0A8J7SJJ0_9BACT|nr:sulfatase [Persicirhabdus sediminis]MBK1791384.1 sulfatase [Persicirhabdus sediminis]
MQSIPKAAPLTRLLIPLLSLGAVIISSSVAKSATLYETTFPANNTNASIASVGWSAWAQHNATGQSQLTDLSASNAGVGATTSNGAYAYFAPQKAPSIGGDTINSPALLFTEANNFSQLEEIESITIEWIGDNTNAKIQLAAEIDGQWHVHQTSFTDSRNNPGSGATPRSDSYLINSSATANDWKLLNNVQLGTSSQLAVGSAATDVSGTITNIGLLIDAGSTATSAGDHLRIKQFTVSSDTPANDTGFTPQRERPNILIIMVDDLKDVPAFTDQNPDALTPNMDKLAAQGTVFKDAHCNYALCGPSRASLMSGLSPATMGFDGHMSNSAVKNRALELGGLVMETHFRNQGYKVFAGGKIYHLGSNADTVDQSGGTRAFGSHEGMEWDQNKTSTDWGVPSYGDSDANFSDYKNGNFAVARLEEEHDKPFLLMVGFVQPHVPWYTPQAYFDRFPNMDALQLSRYEADDMDDVPAEAKRLSIGSQYPNLAEVNGREPITTQQRREIMQAYLACTAFTDDQVGRVLDTLADSPYADNTIIILMSDHGYHLGEKGLYQKHSLWDCSTRIPFVVAGQINTVDTSYTVPSQVIDDKLISLLDLYPTVQDFAGIDKNPMLEGRSIKPLIDNPQIRWDYPAVTTLLGNNHAVKTNDYCYILWNNGEEELYDRIKDPDEITNLAGDSSYDEIKSQLALHLPTNLRSPDFVSRFVINSGSDASVYFNALLAAGKVRIYDEAIYDSNTIVEGMRLNTVTDGKTYTMSLEPATSFGQWRIDNFSIDELRDPATSGTQSDKTMLSYALEAQSAGSWITLTPAGPNNRPQLELSQIANRDDINLYLQQSTSLAEGDWTTIAQSLAGGTLTATNGATIYQQSGSNPVQFKILSDQKSNDEPAGFYRILIVPNF